MPASVITGEGMKFINDDGLDILEKLPMVDFGRHQNGFERFRRREQAIGWIGKNPFSFTLSRIAMPTGGSSSDQGKVFLKPLLLVVQQRPNWTDVEDREAIPALGEHLRNDREEGRLGFATRRGCENDEVSSREEGINRQRLHFSQFLPAKGIDDVMLKCRV